MTLRSAILMFALLSLGGVSSAQTLTSENKLDFPTGSPVVLGEGWNVERQEGTQTICVDFEQKDGDYVDIPNAKLSRASDQQSTYMALSGSSSGQLSLPVGKGSASMDFSLSQKLSTDSIAILIDGTASVAPSFTAPKGGASGSIAEVGLKKEAAELLATGVDAFRSKCGDSFVSVINYGARVIGQYEVRNATENDRGTYDTDVQFSALKFGDAGVSMQGKLGAQLQLDRTDGRVNVTFTQYDAGETTGTDEASMMKALSDLPATARHYRRPMTMTVKAYTSLNSWPESVSIARASPASNLTGAIIKIDALLSVIRDVQQSPDYLKVFDTNPAQIRSLEESLVAKRKTFSDALDRCENGATCDDALLKGFTDYDYRAQLPTKSRLSDLAPSGSVDVLIANLATDRWKTWILDTEGLRCKYNNPVDCMTQNEQLRWLSIITSNIRNALNK